MFDLSANHMTWEPLLDAKASDDSNQKELLKQVFENLETAIPKRMPSVKSYFPSLKAIAVQQVPQLRQHHYEQRLPLFLLLSLLLMLNPLPPRRFLQPLQRIQSILA